MRNVWRAVNAPGTNRASAKPLQSSKLSSSRPSFCSGLTSVAGSSSSDWIDSLVRAVKAAIAGTLSVFLLKREGSKLSSCSSLPAKERSPGGES